jgi:membrane carboxypeptidase/penicillin-binding protein
MKKVTGTSLLAAFIAMVSATAYFAATVAHARRITPGMIDGVLKSEAIRLQLSNFPAEWLDMTLTVEDPSFYQHNGIDLSTPGAGITTITQGMVKYLNKFVHLTC